MPYAKRSTLRNRTRWIAYIALAVIVALAFGVSALSYTGTFSRLRNKTIPPQVAARLSKMSGHPVSRTMSPEAFATPQAYAVWWHSIRSGDWRALAQMQRSGRVIALPAGTPVWYQPPVAQSGLMPVRLFGSRYAGRTYWVDAGYLSSQSLSA